MGLRVALTGHRPGRCEPESAVRIKVRTKLHYTDNIEGVITGMAPGFDVWAADEALSLGLDVWAAIPYAGHINDNELYQKILDASSRVEILDDSPVYPGPGVMFRRNHWMVDNADVVLTYWDGVQGGGTYECRKYALNRDKPIYDLYGDAPF